MADSDRARSLRRRHQHERQAVVFGGLVAGLAVVGLGAAAVYSDAVDAPMLDRDFVTPVVTETGPDLPPPPCPPDGAVPLAYSAVSVAVLNGSTRAGLAGITANDLAGRGFEIASTGNYPSDPGVPAELLFGEAGVAAAYTLAAQLEDAVLVLDTREDASVDLVLGEEFGGLAPAETVELDPEAPLVGVAGCVALEDAVADAVPGPSPTPVEDEEADEVEADEA